MTQTLPVETYVHMIDRSDRDISAQSSMQASWNFPVPDNWSPYQEISLRQIGLVLGLVPTAVFTVFKSGRQVSDSDATAAEMSFGRWIPDFLVFHSGQNLRKKRRMPPLEKI